MDHFLVTASRSSIKCFIFATLWVIVPITSIVNLDKKNSQIRYLPKKLKKCVTPSEGSKTLG